MKTAFNATRLAIAAFLVPYIFCMNPAMLFIDTRPIDVVLIIITSFAGMIAIASALEGYMLRNLNALERILLAAGGLAMLIPGAVTDLVGVGILAAMVVLQLPGRKKTAA